MMEAWKNLECIIAKGYSGGDVFRDWLDLIIFALLRDDPSYLEVMGRYNNAGTHGKRPADYFANAYGAVCVDMKNGGGDVIGELYEEYISRGEHGQFFTPECVSDMMALMVVPETEERLKYSDPACGSGRNLVAAAKRIPNGWACGVDIDARCCKMAAFNLLHRNIAGLIIHGDTLRVEAWQAWEIKASPFGAHLRYHGKDKAEILKSFIVCQNTVKSSEEEETKAHQGVNIANHDEREQLALEL